MWLAQLLRHGLVRPSYIPDREQRELRELTRYRTALIRERASEVNRLQKTLEAANIKLAAVLTGRDRGLGAGDPRRAGQRRGGSREAGRPGALAGPEEARGARAGAGRARLSPTLKFVVKRQLRHIRELDDLIAECDAEVERS